MVVAVVGVVAVLAVVVVVAAFAVSLLLSRCRRCCCGRRRCLLWFRLLPSLLSLWLLRSLLLLRFVCGSALPPFLALFRGVVVVLWAVSACLCRRLGPLSWSVLFAGCRVVCRGPGGRVVWLAVVLFSLCFFFSSFFSFLRGAALSKQRLRWR